LEFSKHLNGVLLYYEIKLKQNNVWMPQFNKNKTYTFPILAACLAENESSRDLNKILMSKMKLNLLSCTEELSGYFLDK
jgi:hypothetical protein